MLGLGLIQGRLQVSQVPRELQQAEEGRMLEGYHTGLPAACFHAPFTEEEAEALEG